ncbi:MAG: DUF2849 domain-containing protein [Alphaproteobacteria bacterium]|nr:DUF2849 domain-containing protein [Alphaproteobacteria bacterium]
MAKSRLGGLQAVTANDLRSGAVVFMRRDGSWTDDVRLADAAQDPVEVERLIELARSGRNATLVVDPVLIEVAAEATGVAPIRLREKIRAAGPTVTFDS